MITTIKKNSKVKVEKKIVKYPIYSDGEENIDDETDDLDDLIKQIAHESNLNNENSLIINIQLTSRSNSQINFYYQDLPNCCGISEIGNLNASNNTPIEEITKVLDLWIKNNKGKTYILNTANQPIWDKALSNCEYWTLVKEFKNRNTNNTIRLYISNNE